MLQWTVVSRAPRVDISRQVYYNIRHVYRQIQRIKTWQLLIILVLSGFVAATFLRLNNVGMDQRRAAVLLADKEGRDDDVFNRMYDLQRYVSAHMNTSTGQFDLTEQYKRDAQEAISAVSNDSNPNGNIFAKAQEVCRQRYPTYQAGSYLAYQQCTLDEIDKYPSAPELKNTLDLPNPALYRHSFAAPVWSPDFAGFSTLFFALIALVIIGRWLHFGLLHLLLKLRHKGISS